MSVMSRLATNIELYKAGQLLPEERDELLATLARLGWLHLVEAE